MKSNLIAVGIAAVLAISGPVALAQSANSGDSKTSREMTKRDKPAHNATTGDAVTTGSGAPADKPNLSSSSQTSDTGRSQK